MTNTNKLADALRMLIEHCVVSDDLCYGTMSTAFVRKIAEEALAEHDAQPAAAPVQVDDVCPRCSSAWEPSPVSIPGGAMDRCSNADCCNMRWARPRRFTAAHPP